MPKPTLKIRIDHQQETVLGPGKLVLLQAIQTHGSISAAAKSMQMSYRRAWELVDVMNQHFQKPVVMGMKGGAQGGGAQLTPFGEQLVVRYQALIDQATAAVLDEMTWITQHLNP